MLNALTYSLQYIKQEIPEKLLELGFKDDDNEINAVISLDERIRAQLLRPIILTDMNVVGGVNIKIDITKCGIRQMSDTLNEYIIDVPYTLTDGRTIMSVTSLVSSGYVTSNISNGTLVSGNPVVNALDRVFNAHDTPQVIHTDRLEVLGDNVILVRSANFVITSCWLNCYIENNNNLENINPRSYPAIAEFMTLGVQRYLYNTLKIKFDQGYIHLGHDLSVMTEILDSYADAKTMYKEMLKTIIAKTLFMNDNISMSKYVASMMGSSI